MTNYVKEATVKKLTLTITIAAVLGAVFLVLAFPVSAARPEPVRFTLDMCSDPDGFAVGTFTVDFRDDDTIDDHGTALGPFRMTSGTVHAKWLLDGQSGEIIMKFNASVTPVSPNEEQWIGHFVLVSGTGATYERLHGQGSIDLDLDLTGSGCPIDTYPLTGEYSGMALYAPPDCH